jgi:hypothetical protein
MYAMQPHRSRRCGGSLHDLLAGPGAVQPPDARAALAKRREAGLAQHAHALVAAAGVALAEIRLAQAVGALQSKHKTDLLRNGQNAVSWLFDFGLLPCLF